MQADIESVTNLLRDPVIIRIVTVLDIASLSILELLEYNITRRDISHALSNGVIEMERSTLPKEAPTVDMDNLLMSGDVYYYSYLSSKVHLTELGKHILASLKEPQNEQDILNRARQMLDSEVFAPPSRPDGLL